ncbi:hypothetical protein ASD04_00090 [Devosia sp. Root436]|uniref:hypothetical protein n=1 Tax=Devosia sp. Root436 TaxID=1736537 RepID=UPI0006FD04AF|nr:hypothetical protein [Devosia sp. Root436]KQX42409.1 hypothetical protein ASD04_00090 [Devosia sp. Root436]
MDLNLSTLRALEGIAVMADPKNFSPATVEKCRLLKIVLDSIPESERTEEMTVALDMCRAVTRNL